MTAREFFYISYEWAKMAAFVAAIVGIVATLIGLETLAIAAWAVFILSIAWWSVYLHQVRTWKWWNDENTSVH